MFDEMNRRIGFVVLDSDHRYIRADQTFCRMIEYGEDDLVLRSLIDMIHRDDRSKSLHLLDQLVKDDMASSKWQSRFVTRSGRILRAQMTATSAPDQEKKSIQSLIMVEEIPANPTNDNSRRIEALAAIGESASMLVHEIRNGLSGLAVPAALLERQMTKPELRTPHLLLSLVRELRAGLDQLNALLTDFGSFASPLKVNLVPTYIFGFLSEILATEEVRYTTNNIRVEIDVPDDLPAILIDRQKFKRALLNLCRNAAEAMPHGGTLTIRAYVAAEAVCLEIKDTGVGIPNGIDVFNYFMTTKPDGTGLGLPIVRKIVSAHGGTVTYMSEEQKGTTFRVVLPKDLVLRDGFYYSWNQTCSAF
jgi:two-component system sensor histidine kinase AtoS